MKWSSQYMSRAYKWLILTTGFTLIILGFILGNSESSIPFSAYFLAVILLLIVIIFWKSFDIKDGYQGNSGSSPGVTSLHDNHSELSTIETESKTSIPNPLDSDIDIPLM